jgi:hypothetical protein
MAIQRLRKRIAKPRTPDIQSVSERPQRIADAPRRRHFLVQDDQNRQQRLGGFGRDGGRRCPAGEAQHGFGVDFDRPRRHRFSFWRLIGPESYLNKR